MLKLNNFGITMGQPDRQQRGGSSKSIPRIKSGGISKLVAPHCCHQLTPDGYAF